MEYKRRGRDNGQLWFSYCNLRLEVGETKCDFDAKSRSNWLGIYTNDSTLQISSLKKYCWASLVAQWLGVRLLVQGTRVRALVQEDPTCHRATGPVRHDCWACALEPPSHDSWARVPRLLKPAHVEPKLCSGRGHLGERPVHLSEEWPPLAAAGESPRAAKKTQSSHK